MHLVRRVKRIERATAPAGGCRECPECGAAPGEPERFTLLPIDLDVPAPHPGPDACADCGRRLVVRMGPITLDGPALPV